MTLSCFSKTSNGVQKIPVSATMLRMKILILETSGEKSCIIFTEGPRPIAWKELSGGPQLSKQLAQEVATLLGPLRPELIAVGTGPGSYTGIRVGAALAKTLAYGWQIPLIGFCSLKAFTPCLDGPFAILVDARMGGLYTLFGERKDTLLTFQTPSLQPLTLSFPASLPLASPHPEVLKKKSSLPNPWIETKPDPTLLSALIYQQYLDEGIHPLELTYLSSP